MDKKSSNFQIFNKFWFKKKTYFFRSFTNWYFFVFILLRILCWFRICYFFRFWRYWRWKFGKNPKNAVFWTRFAMDTVFFGTNRLVLVKATQGRYWAAMLGSVLFGVYMFRSVSLVSIRCRHQVQFYYFGVLKKFRICVFDYKIPIPKFYFFFLL